MKESKMEQQPRMEGQENHSLQDSQTQETMDLTITDFFGNTVTLRPKIELYSVKDFMGHILPGLALDLYMIDDELGEPEPYATLTKCFGEYISIQNSAYIDTNNCPFADQLLAQGIAEATGLSKSSGFCTYPLWVFKEDFLQKIGGENYQIYTQAYEQYNPFSAFYDDEESDMADDEYVQEQTSDGPDQGMTMGGM